MAVNERERSIGADRVWLAFIFNKKAEDFEYFGKDLGGLVYIHPELERIHFGIEFVYCYKYLGLALVYGQLLVDRGSESWKYKAFKDGFEKKKPPSRLRFLRRYFYDLGVRERDRFH